MKRNRILTVVISLLCLGVASVVLAADGDIDTTYGTNGLSRTIESGLGAAVDIAVQADDKSVVLSAKNTDFAVLRFNTDGSRDTTFGTGGEVLINFATSSSQPSDAPQAIVIQPDGKILVAGSTSPAGNPDFAIARLNSDGTLDASFGNGGLVTTDFSGNTDLAYDIIVQSDNKIVVVGAAAVGNHANYKFAVARYNDNGSLDNSFANGGTRIISWGFGFNVATGVAQQADGKLVVVGVAKTPNYDFAIARLRVNGKIDHTFGSNGRVSTTFSSPPVDDSQAKSVAIASDGKIVVGGGPYVPWGHYYVARYMSDGSLDSSFATGGQSDTAVASYSASPTTISIANGQIILGGYSQSSDACALTRYDVTLVRYNDDGTLDTNFGNSGIALYNPYPATISYCVSGMTVRGMALQSDGKIVVAGGDYLSTNFVGLIAARFYN